MTKWECAFCKVSIEGAHPGPNDFGECPMTHGPHNWRMAH